MQLELLTASERHFLHDLKYNTEHLDVITLESIPENLRGYSMRVAHPLVEQLVEKGYLSVPDEDFIEDEDPITFTADFTLFQDVLNALINGHAKDAVKMLDGMMHEERKFTIESLSHGQLKTLYKARYYDE